MTGRERKKVFRNGDPCQADRTAHSLPHFIDLEKSCVSQQMSTVGRGV